MTGKEDHQVLATAPVRLTVRDDSDCKSRPLSDRPRTLHASEHLALRRHRAVSKGGSKHSRRTSVRRIRSGQRSKALDGCRSISSCICRIALDGQNGMIVDIADDCGAWNHGGSFASNGMRQQRCAMLTIGKASPFRLCRTCPIKFVRCSTSTCICHIGVRDFSFLWLF